MQRADQAMAQIAEVISQFEVALVKGFATSAVRESANSDAFLALASAHHIDIEVLSGDQEAEYIYYGVKTSFEMGEVPYLIMDIGGGSTEFVIANGSRIYFKKSYLLGVARLKELFFTDVQLNAESKLKMQNYLKRELSDLTTFLQHFGPIHLVGSSGSFDTYFEMLNPKEFVENLTFFRFNNIDFKSLLDRLIHSTHEERLQMQGLIPLRVDMIAFAAFLTQFILHHANIQTVCASTYSLKEGVIKKLQEQLWPES